MMPYQQWFRAVVGLVAIVAAAPAAVSAAGCPSEVLFEPTGLATLDAGWSGFAHDRPIPGTTLDLAISCAASDPPCGTCPITGVVANPAGHRQRCSNDTSIECTVASEVADCGAPGRCRYYLAPPQSLVAGGLPLCALMDVNGAVGGSVDVETGAFAPLVPLNAAIYFGSIPPGGPLNACPRCNADAVANDTVRDGVCDAGPRAGLSCDVNTTFPFAEFGSASFDCPPEGPLFGTIVNTIAFSTSPQTRTLTLQSPPCEETGVPPGSRCFCSTCNNAVAEPCSANADCPPSGGNPGICGGRRCIGGANDGTPCATGSECPSGFCLRQGERTRPHACFDDTTSPVECMPVANDLGVCTAGPADTECSNHYGRGCLDDGDCDDVAGACVSVLRSCFTDQGVIGGAVSVDAAASAPVDGVASPTDLGALTCLPPTTNAFINVWGLPGLGRIHQPGRLAFGDAIPTPTPTATPAVGFCPATPDACRTPTVTGRSPIQLRDRSPDDKDRLNWKWAKGAATTVAELGDPTVGDDYALCLYDGPDLRAVMPIPAGSTCGNRPCWQTKRTGFVYRNSSGTPDGVVQLILKAGADGKAQMQAKGKGTLLPMPALLSLTSPLQVQLRNTTSGLCFGATYVPPFDQVTAELLKDRDD